MHRSHYAIATACTLLLLALLALLGGCARLDAAQTRDASAPAPGNDRSTAVARAAEVLAALDVAATHCPQIRIDRRQRERILAAAGREESALREDEAYLRQLLTLNPLIEGYEHETGCRLLSRSREADAPGLMRMD